MSYYALQMRGGRAVRRSGQSVTSPLIPLDASLDLLLGPLTPIGTTTYDTIQLTQAAAWDEVDVSPWITSAYFYDGGLAYYTLYYRTGDPQWLTRAHALAVGHADFTLYSGLGLDGEGRTLMPARDYSTLGLAIHYLLTGNTDSRDAVRSQAAAGYWYFSPYSAMTSADARESAYALKAMLATTIIGGDSNNYATAMAAAVDTYIAGQGGDATVGDVQPNEGWQGWSNWLAGDGLYVSNYMNGIVAEALILYDRYIGDARIVPALKQWADWLWSTQWVPLGGGPAQYGTSTTSFTPGTGSKTFTTQAGLQYNGSLVGLPALIFSRTVPVAPDTYDSMSGLITAYSGTSLTVDVTQYTDTIGGAHADWDITLCAYPGQQSADGIGCFQYETTFHGLDGTAILPVTQLSDNAHACLMGIILPAFGYLYARGQGAAYKTNGDAILAGLAQAAYFDVKQFNQAYRSSPTYLGWTV